MDGQCLVGLRLGSGMSQVQQGGESDGLLIMAVPLGQLSSQRVLNPRKPDLLARGADIRLAPPRPLFGPAPHALGVDLGTGPQGMRLP